MAPSISEPSTHVTIPTPIRALLVGGLIYLFLVGVSSLEKGIKIMGADTQERLFESVSNPIAGLCIGILGTVLVQSSSASTAVIVGLVATGNVTVDEAVPMIMGANVGTTQCGFDVEVSVHHGHQTKIDHGKPPLVNFKKSQKHIDTCTKTTCRLARRHSQERCESCNNTLADARTLWPLPPSRLMVCGFVRVLAPHCAALAFFLRAALCGAIVCQSRSNRVGESLLFYVYCFTHRK